MECPPKKSTPSSDLQIVEKYDCGLMDFMTLLLLLIFSLIIELLFYVGILILLSPALRILLEEK